ncbi:hypothetical protein [Achromobacter aloeverae]|nr:hypothetical protein [Achromobacter aloeverae]
MTILRDGPYLRAIGWLCGQDHAARVATTRTWDQLANPVDFTDDGGYRLRADTEAGVPASPCAAVMQGSGVARARSAAKSTVYAALLGRRLLDTVAPRDGYHGDHVGVAVASGSTITPIAWDFETTGLRKGWRKTDTLLLPSSIPSAIATQVSAALDTHAAALAFQDGALGVCAAFEYAHLAFAHRRADYFLVMGADEVSQIQGDALAALGDTRPVLNGASGLVLGRTPHGDQDWQLRLCAHVDRNAGDVGVAGDVGAMLPGDWPLAVSRDIGIKDNPTLFTAPLLAYALHDLLRHAGRKAVLTCRLPGRGAYVLGFSRRKSNDDD